MVETRVPLKVKVLPVLTLIAVPPVLLMVRNLALIVESCVTVISLSRFHEPQPVEVVPPQPSVPPANVSVPGFKWNTLDMPVAEVKVPPVLMVSAKPERKLPPIKELLSAVVAMVMVPPLLILIAVA